jgi:three-Cys-motif partner protein
MRKNGSVEQARPHTFEAKHRIYRYYLGAWFSIFLRTTFPEKLTIIDAFAGPGVYPGNGKPGSPVIIIEELLKALDGRPPTRPIELIFIEADEKDFARLEKTLDEWEPKLPAGVRLTVRHGRCQDLALPLLRERRGLGAKRPVLAFFDAEGYDIPYPLVKAIAANDSSEVLVTLVTARFVQFAGKPNAKADSVFGDSDWRDVTEQPASLKHEYLAAEYEGRLHWAPFRWVRPFAITEETGYPLHIFFGTNHPKGWQAMKRPQWKVDPISGGHFRDPDNPAQLGLDLTLTADLAPLKMLLRDGLLSDHEWHTVNAVRRSMLASRFEESHVNKALGEMVDTKDLERQGGKTARLTGDVQIRLMQSLF